MRVWTRNRHVLDSTCDLQTVPCVAEAFFLCIDGPWWKHRLTTRWTTHPLARSSGTCEIWILPSPEEHRDLFFPPADAVVCLCLLQRDPAFCVHCLDGVTHGWEWKDLTISIPVPIPNTCCHWHLSFSGSAFALHDSLLPSSWCASSLCTPFHHSTWTDLPFVRIPILLVWSRTDPVLPPIDPRFVPRLFGFFALSDGGKWGQDRTGFDRRPPRNPTRSPAPTWIHPPRRPRTTMSVLVPKGGHSNRRRNPEAP